MQKDDINLNSDRIEEGKYNIIYADPPWRFKNWSMDEMAKRGEKWARRNGRSPYDVMNLEDICALPVSDIAAKNSVLFMWATYPKLEESFDVIKAWGFCCSPETQILKSDLTWMNAGDLSIGDKLLAFDESINGIGRRYYSWSYVEDNSIIERDCYKIILDNGEEIISSYDHEWLCRYRQPCGRTGIATWRTVSDMLSDYNGRRKSQIELIKLANIVREDRSYESGFISGSFDSEGSLNSVSPRICFSQKDNALLHRCMEYLDYFNITYGIHDIGRNVLHLDIQGGFMSTLDFLQRFRPPRLLKNWERYNFNNNSLYNLSANKIIQIEHLGIRPVSALQTSSRTYIANGYASHNTYKTVGFTWVKQNKSGVGFHFGLGYYTRGNPEICLLATRGKGLRRYDNSIPNLVISPVGRHSQKPDDVRSRIERLHGNVPMIELFARQRPSDRWDIWGNEAPGGSDIELEIVETNE